MTFLCVIKVHEIFCPFEFCIMLDPLEPGGAEAYLFDLYLDKCVHIMNVYISLIDNLTFRKEKQF